jgi:hypothetical protein
VELVRLTVCPDYRTFVITHVDNLNWLDDMTHEMALRHLLEQPLSEVMPI